MRKIINGHSVVGEEERVQGGRHELGREEDLVPLINQ